MKPWISLCLSLPLVVPFASAAAGAQNITFAAPKPISVGAAAGQVAYNPQAGNFNGDDKTDFAVQLYNPDGTSQLNILLGDGSGSFSVLTVIRKPVFIDAFFVADLNGDGKDDILTVHGACDNTYYTCNGPGVGAFTVYLNDGTAHFTVGDVISLPFGLAGGALGDFNQDGSMDVAVFVCGPALGINVGEQQVFLNRGDGTFTTSPLTAVPASYPCAYDLLEGDFNGDGHPDLVAFTSGPLYGTTQIFTLLGKGDATFATPELSYTIDSTTVDMRAADLNGDGKTDLVVSLEPKNQGGIFVQGAQPRVVSLIRKTNGKFYWQSALSTDFTVSTPGISLADLRGDGTLDLIRFAGHFGPSTAELEVLVDPGLGGGTFGPRREMNISSAGGYWGSAASPLVRGERPSLMVASGLPTLVLFINTTK